MKFLILLIFPMLSLFAQEWMEIEFERRCVELGGIVDPEGYCDLGPVVNRLRIDTNTTRR